MRQDIRHLPNLCISALATGLLLTACSSIDCPLNNKVYAMVRFTGDGTWHEDTLSIWSPLTEDTAGEDTVLVNRLVGKDSIAIPMSYVRNTDTYVICRMEKDTQTRTEDTIRVRKESRPHMQSVDCNPAFFHTIHDVRFTTYGIENVTITNNNVSYNDAQAHLLIRFKDSNP